MQPFHHAQNISSSVAAWNNRNDTRRGYMSRLHIQQILLVIICCLFSPSLSAQTIPSIQLITTVSACANPASVAVNNVTGILYVACSSDSVIAVNGTSIQPLTTSSQCYLPYQVAVNSATNVVFAICSGATIISINGSTVQTIANSATCSNPRGITTNSASGLVYIACSDSINIVSYRNSTPKAERFLGTAECTSPYGVAYNPVSDLLVVACYTGVATFNGTSFTVIASASQSPSTTGVAVNVQTGIVYAISSSGILAISNSITTVASRSNCLNANSVAVNSVSNVVYASCAGAQNTVTSAIVLINGTNVQTMATSNQCAYAINVAVDSNTNTIYGACRYGSLLRMNGSAVLPLSMPSQCPGPQSVMTDSDTGINYASCTGSPTSVIAINSSSVSLIADDTLCPSPLAVILNKRTNTINIACFSKGVLAINSTNSQIITGQQCPYPYHLAVNQKTGVLFGACGSGVVSVDGAQVQMIANSTVCSASAVAVNEATGVVYAVCQDGSVATFNGSSIERLNLPSSVCASPTKLAFDRVTAIMYLVCGFPSQLVIIKGDTIQSVALVNCNSPSNLAVNSVTGVVFLACRDTVLAFNGSSTTTIASSSDCPNVIGVSVSSRTGIVAAACYNSGIVSIRLFGNVVVNQLVVTGPAVADVAQPVSLVATIVPSEVINSAVTWFVDDEIIPSCIRTPIVQGSASCVTAFASGSRSITVMFLGSAVYKYGTISPPFMLQVGFCTGPPTLLVTQDKSNCSFPQYPLPHMTACQANCLSSYPGPTVTYTCLNSRWSQSSPTVCQLPFTALQSLPSSTPAASATMNLAIVPNFPPTLSPVTIDVSCTGNGTVSGSPLVFPLNSTTPRYWSYLSPPSSIISPIVCTFSTAVNASFYQLPSSQSAAIVTYCNVCPPGQQNMSDSSTDLPICELCSAGKASPLGVKCVDCTPGSAASGTGQAYCSLCAVGTYQKDSGASTCQPCPIGTIASTNGLIECSPCPSGSVPSSTSATCTPCPPGTYISNADPMSQPQCVACSVGRFAVNSSSLSCTDCPPGQVATSPGQAYCTSCLPGEEKTVDSSTGVTICSPCAAGTFSQNGEACVQCPSGFYSSQPSTFSCSACSQGTASNVTGLSATSCPSCPPGRYQSQSASTSCIECSAQRYSPEPGSISCLLCTKQVSSNRTECSDHVCANTNLVYSDVSATCEPCTLGSSGIGGVCAVCAIGYYTPVAGAACKSCHDVEGLVCSNGLASVAAGYWAYIPDNPVDEASIGAFQTSPCPADFCLGSALQQSNSSDSMQTTIQLCTSPRLNSPTNVLCGNCEEGYIPWGTQCVQCSDWNGGLIVGVIFISFIFVMFLYATSDQSAAGPVAILMFFIQTAALEVNSVTKWLSWVQFLNLGVHSTSSCLGKLNAYEQMFLSLLVPLLLLAELAVLAGVHYLFHISYSQSLHESTNTQYSDSSNTNSDASQQNEPARPAGDSVVARSISPSVSQQTATWLMNAFSWNRYIACIMSVLLFCYTQVAVASFSYLNCADVGSARVVFTSPTIDCQSSQYRQYLPAAIFAIVIYIVGFPLSVVSLLWYHKETLFVSVVASHTSAADIKSSLAGFFLRWSPLFQMFHPRAWFFTPLLLIRRSTYVLISILLVEQANARFMAFTLLNFSSLLFHLLVQPFDSKKLNYIESASYAILVFISAILGGTTRPYTVATQAILLLLVVIPSFSLLIYIIRGEWLKYQQRKRNERTDTIFKADPASIGHQAVEMVTNVSIESHELASTGIQPRQNQHAPSADVVDLNLQSDAASNSTIGRARSSTVHDTSDVLLNSTVVSSDDSSILL